jgi:putative secretion ATPase (PEP-CTERM system associated)
MYEEFYKLSTKPFQLAPDPRFFYASQGHQRAMAYLRYGLQQGQGFIVVTGDVGTGKTMLVANLFRDLVDKSIVAAKVVSTNVRESDLLRLVAAEFGIRYENTTKGVLLRRLEEFFRTTMANGQRVLLVVDEVQNLPKASLEELRMLSNFEFEGRPLLQSFLLGQREFRGVIRSAGFEQVRQRVIAAYHLRPLGEREIRPYVEHRLKIAGWAGDPMFDDPVYAGIHAFTRGLPRRINTLCDRLLLNACLDERHHITRAEFDTVTAELRGEYAEIEESDEQVRPELAEPRTAPVDIRSARPAVAAAGDAPIAEAAPPSPGIAELEARLASMQTMVESLTRSVQQSMATRLPEPVPESMPDQVRFTRWAIAAGVATFAILAVVGVGLFLVFRN